MALIDMYIDRVEQDQARDETARDNLIESTDSLASFAKSEAAKVVKLEKELATERASVKDLNYQVGQLQNQVKELTLVDKLVPDAQPFDTDSIPDRAV